MDSKVIVLKDETTGAVVNVSNTNAEYGYIKVQQIRTVIDDNGFLRRKPVSALIQGTLQELQDSNFYGGQALDGKIVIEESLTPFNNKTPERDLKVAGETGIVCRLGGMPIYRRTKFTLTSNASDDLIKHDNVDELRAAYNTPKTSAVTPNKDFEI
jgi:hypothetical protein